MFTTLTKALNLKSEEYFKNLEEIPETPESIKAYVPTLMPLIPLGEEPKEDIKMSINQSIFCNDKGCSIMSTPSVINAQNYITLYPYPNEYPNFRGKSTVKDGAYVVEKHSTFILSVVGEDLDTLYFTGRS